MYATSIDLEHQRFEAMADLHRSKDRVMVDIPFEGRVLHNFSVLQVEDQLPTTVSATQIKSGWFEGKVVAKNLAEYLMGDAKKHSGWTAEAGECTPEKLLSAINPRMITEVFQDCVLVPTHQQEFYRRSNGAVDLVGKPERADLVLIPAMYRTPLHAVSALAVYHMCSRWCVCCRCWGPRGTWSFT